MVSRASVANRPVRVDSTIATRSSKVSRSRAVGSSATVRPGSRNVTAWADDERQGRRVERFVAVHEADDVVVRGLQPGAACRAESANGLDDHGCSHRCSQCCGVVGGAVVDHDRVVSVEHPPENPANDLGLVQRGQDDVRHSGSPGRAMRFVTVGTTGCGRVVGCRVSARVGVWCGRRWCRWGGGRCGRPVRGAGRTAARASGRCGG